MIITAATSIFFLLAAEHPEPVRLPAFPDRHCCTWEWKRREE